MLQLLETIQILNGDEFPIEVLALELVVRAEAKDPLLLELAHQELLHLTMGQLAIIVQS